MQETSGHVIGVGETIDTYLLEAVIATGSTSTTFRARDRRLDRAVMLKVLHGEMFAGVPGARERAVVDATLAASLEHPNIVPVYGAGEVGEGLWVASRLTDGDALADAVLSPRRTAELLERVAGAIDAAHVIGAIHREIRPECIVLDRWGNPLVRDYGVTRTSGRTGMATRMELLDTLRYAAPELILGRGPTPAADIYGLAAVAVRCLTGTHPFPDLPVSELVALRTQAPPPVLVGPG
ncbi:MAG: serine/threonine-protein kinase, partial [Solirubrobacteraceae bacterium]